MLYSCFNRSCLRNVFFVCFTIASALVSSSVSARPLPPLLPIHLQSFFAEYANQQALAHPIAGVNTRVEESVLEANTIEKNIVENNSADPAEKTAFESAPTATVADSTDTLDIPKRPFRYTMDGSLPRTYTQLDPLKTALVGGGFTAVLGGLQIYQYNAFWSDRTTFRIIDDGDLEYGADKGGHFFAAYTMSKFATDALMTSGFSHDLAVISGGLIGAGYQFFVEVQDGFGRGWGFSPSDVYANTAGSVFHILQHFVPFFSNLQYKAEFFPAPWFGEKTRKGASTPIDDYSAWTWWVSVNVHNMLPEFAKPFWPSWLNISVGYAARNLEWADASRRYIIGLDWNLEKILPEGGPFWNWLRQYLNVIKLPAPALEFAFTPDGKPMGPPRLHLIFPFKFASIQF
jgi:Predicted periplasmic lipoprotein (DUF2279)